MARRIDMDDKGELDDVAIDNVSLFRLERMDKCEWWAAVYYEDGGRDTFWLSSKGRISGRHTDERTD